MHDPMTVAFTIKAPWWYRPKSGPFKGKRYHATLVTIWHVDPEKGGSDDSCGYTVPHLSKCQRKRLKSWAWHEGRNPYFLRYRSKEWDMGRAEAEAIYRGLLLHVARVARIRMTYTQAALQAALTIHDPDCIDPASRLCFLPGYHSNSKEDRQEDREQHFYEVICGIARWMKRGRRSWWRHPRWHFWHWRFQVHPLQSLWRRLFVRCSRCGGSFGWKESAIGSWSGNKMWHERCEGIGAAKA